MIFVVEIFADNSSRGHQHKICKQYCLVYAFMHIRTDTRNSLPATVVNAATHDGLKYKLNDGC
jgi:hypothetical protein